MEGKVKYLNMSPASNGFTINYSIEKKSSNAKTYDNCCSESKTEVFSTEDADKAISRFKELSGLAEKKEEIKG